MFQQPPSLRSSIEAPGTHLNKCLSILHTRTERLLKAGRVHLGHEVVDCRDLALGAQAEQDGRSGQSGRRRRQKYSSVDGANVLRTYNMNRGRKGGVKKT